MAGIEQKAKRVGDAVGTVFSEESDVKGRWQGVCGHIVKRAVQVQWWCGIIKHMQG